MRYHMMMSRFFVAAMAMGLSACTMKLSLNVNASQNEEARDTTPPSIPGLVLQTPSSSPGNVAAPTFEVSLTGGDSFLITDTIEIFDGINCVGNSVGTATGISGTSTTIMVSAQAEGSLSYSVLVTDASGNASCSSSNATSALRSVAYLYDGTGPTWANSLAIGSYSFNSLSRTPPMTFTADADDGSGTGVAKYQYALGTTSGASDVVSWTDLAGGSSPTTSVQITGLSLTKGSNYYFSMRAVDNVQNLSGVQTQGFLAKESFYDNTHTFLINNGASYTNVYDVTLSFLELAGAHDMYITQTAGCGSGGSWEAVNTQASWTLSASNQVNTVYVKYRAQSGEESDCVSASITHDDIGPTAPVFVSFNYTSPSTFTSLITYGRVSSDTKKVRLYPSSSCSKEMGSTTSFSSRQFGASLNSSMMFGTQLDVYAKAFDQVGNGSGCAYMGTFQNNGAAASGSWWAMSSVASLSAPSARSFAQMVWTGTEAIVWGSGSSSNTGARYNPTTDSWVSTNIASAPSILASKAVWTGSQMLVWGSTTGALYDPITDSWTSMGTYGAPQASSPTVVWASNKLIVWGGYLSGAYLNTGAIYDPLTDSWTAMSSTNGSGAPSGRWIAGGVWTGSKMIIWAGQTSGSVYLNTGGIYDPAADSWSSMTATGAPEARSGSGAAMAWTGAELVVWGGYGTSGNLNTGGIYNPATDTWTATNMSGVPSGRQGMTSVWTGSEMIVWGGYDGTSYLNTGGRYNPTTDTWAATNTIGVTARNSFFSVWTGSEMIVWGGYNGTSLNTGARYNPATDTWTTMSTGTIPFARADFSTVWTGSQMIVWGGYDGANYLNSGGRYDPVTDSWASTSLINAPSVRSQHAAVWASASSKMIVWGGYNGSSYLGTGGLYDPSADTWISASTTGAPSARATNGGAVWTGTEMIVWGGYDGTSYLNTGGRYSPSTDSWTTMTTTSAPAIRASNSAVWTGSLFVVWGGWNGSTALNTGGRYDPSLDSWSATAATTVTARYTHSTVWAPEASVMIVWGGWNGTTRTNTGGRYNPTTNTWIATSTSGPPTARNLASAVWTGSKMIIWGGSSTTGSGLNSGGLYDPSANTWTSTGTLGSGAPVARYSHGAVWTGSYMVIWGGQAASTTYLNSGSRYAP